MLGAGSFGRVFFGLNMVTGELMAVKQINYTPGQPTDATRLAAQALLGDADGGPDACAADRGLASPGVASEAS